MEALAFEAMMPGMWIAARTACCALAAQRAEHAAWRQAHRAVAHAVCCRVRGRAMNILRQLGSVNYSPSEFAEAVRPSGAAATCRSQSHYCLHATALF